jgi:hypothetical protein
MIDMLRTQGVVRVEINDKRRLKDMRQLAEELSTGCHAHIVRLDTRTMLFGRGETAVCFSLWALLHSLLFSSLNLLERVQQPITRCTTILP